MEKVDYKELIERLRDNQKFSYRAVEYLCIEAAAAIETLLAEREAAVAEIQKECSKCAHFGTTAEEQPCHDCWYIDGPMKHWQWCGTTPPDREKK